MSKSKALSLRELQLIQSVVPSLCSIAALEGNELLNAQNDDDRFELKFWSRITPSNIAKLAGKFKNAITKKKRSRSPSKCTDSERPRKRRKLRHRNSVNLDDEDSNSLRSPPRWTLSSSTSTADTVDGDGSALSMEIKALPSTKRRALKRLQSVAFSPSSFLEHSKSFEFWTESSIVSTRCIAAKSAQFEAVNLLDSDCGPTAVRMTSIPSVLRSALSRTKGIEVGDGGAGLYRHQSMALRAICSGFHCVISTATASGKSLCYHIPVLSWICEHPQSRNLYVFPTKALAQDQKRALQLILDALNPKLAEMKRTEIRCGCFDGDTPWNERMRLLRECQVQFGELVWFGLSDSVGILDDSDSVGILHEFASVQSLFVGHSVCQCTSKLMERVVIALFVGAL